MSLNVSRRDFIVNSASAGAAGAALMSVGGAWASDMATPQAAASADLLHALGARIGLEVAAALGDASGPYALTYLDGAGESVDALREGIETGMRWEAGHAPLTSERAIHPSSLLGVALVRNPDTGKSARVDINTIALYMLTVIEDTPGPSSSKKLAVMTTDARELYRVQYSA
jgi:hypothetical protein